MLSPFVYFSLYTLLCTLLNNDVFYVSGILSSKSMFAYKHYLRFEEYKRLNKFMYVLVLYKVFNFIAKLSRKIEGKIFNYQIIKQFNQLKNNL